MKFGALFFITFLIVCGLSAQPNVYTLSGTVTDSVTGKPIAAGYSAVKLGENIVIIYNDGEKDMKKSEIEKIAETSSPKDIILVEALINKDKKLEYRKQIGNGTDSRYTYYLGNTIPLTGTSMLFPIGKQGLRFNERETYYTNWCLLTLQL